MKTELNKMRCLDIFVNCLSTHDYSKISPSLKSVNTSFRDLISADMYLSHFNSIQSNFNPDIDTLQQMSKDLDWRNDIKNILEENQFESLVVTDTSKKILWVNNGFEKMTGYSKKYAVNKTPAFLQGDETLDKTRKKIRKKLNNKTPFKEVILNYKKDNSPYKCELYIFPLYNVNNKITHYLALEKQVA